MSKSTSWRELLLLHRNQHIGDIGRNEFVSNKYIIFKHILKNRLKISNTEYIKQTILKTDEQYILTNNDFQYDLSRNIVHMLLWINPNNNNNDWIAPSVDLNKLDYFQKIIYDKLVSRLKSKSDSNTNIEKDIKYIYFENEEKHRSIPEFRHFHIFILNS